MRAASVALINLLNSSSQILVADLLTIVPLSGSTLRFTNAATPLTVVSRVDNASHTFTPFVFRRGATKLVVGLEHDTMPLTLSPTADQTLIGLPWPAAVRGGALDEARVIIERVFMATWGDTSAGTLIEFAGRVGQADPSRSSIEVQVVSDLELLSAELPRNVYQPGCLHALFDTGCALSRVAFSASGTAHSGSTARSIVTGLSDPDDYYRLGTITFSDGPNAGLTRTVKSYLSGAAVPIVAFPFAPGVGDNFSISAGCDKQQSTCSSKFSNLAHFRGYPYIPQPELAH